MSVANKDSQNQSLQQLADVEKERRVSESAELRRMLSETEERAIQAVREAERNSAKHSALNEQLRKADLQLQEKQRGLDSLQKRLDQEKANTLRQESSLNEKLDRERQLIKAEVADRSTSLEIKLNKREADLQTLENKLVEMHNKMHSLS